MVQLSLNMKPIGKNDSTWQRQLMELWIRSAQSRAMSTFESRCQENVVPGGGVRKNVGSIMDTLVFPMLKGIFLRLCHKSE